MGAVGPLFEVPQRDLLDPPRHAPDGPVGQSAEGKLSRGRVLFDVLASRGFPGSTTFSGRGSGESEPRWGRFGARVRVPIGLIISAGAK